VLTLVVVEAAKVAELVLVAEAVLVVQAIRQTVQAQQQTLALAVAVLQQHLMQLFQVATEQLVFALSVTWFK
jgi:hypothetical protein